MMRHFFNYLTVLGAVALLAGGCARRPMRSADGTFAGAPTAEELRVRDSGEHIVEEQHSERERATKRDKMRRSDSAEQAEACRMEDSLRFGRRVIDQAQRHLGARYAYGKMGPEAFDCSGFTLFVFRACGVRLDHSSGAQYRQGHAVSSRKELRIGDLVFFGGRNNPTVIGHVGIVTKADPKTGCFSFIHADSRGVRISSSTEAYYAARYVGARRFYSPEE